jgi:death-on-curing protein
MKKSRRAWNPKWIDLRALTLLHQESLGEHGGLAGLRSIELLESALARPRQIFSYEHETDLLRLAAAYAAGLARNHPFVDGNKRAAFLAAGLFLELNGQELAADQVEAAHAVLALASGEMSELQFTEWIRLHTKRYRKR